MAWGVGPDRFCIFQMVPAFSLPLSMVVALQGKWIEIVESLRDITGRVSRVTLLYNLGRAQRASKTILSCGQFKFSANKTRLKFFLPEGLSMFYIKGQSNEIFHLIFDRNVLFPSPLRGYLKAFQILSRI
jgi:hypothetical protein